MTDSPALSPATDPMADIRRHAGVALLLAFAISVCYSNTLHGEWHFDDRPNIVDNPGVRTFENVSYYWSQRIQRPLAYVSFWLNWTVSGDSTFGYHVTNTVIHWLAALCVYALVWTTFRLPLMTARYGRYAGGAALFSALLWSVHPIQTQAVTYIVQRMASMCGMFMFASLWLYALGRSSSRPLPRSVWWGLSLLLFCCAILTKEIAVVQPFLILMYEFCFFRGADWNLFRRPVVYVSLIVVPLFALVLGAMYVGTSFGEFLDKGYQEREGQFNMFERVLTQWRVLWTYLSLLVFPHPSRLSLEWDYPVSRGLFDPPTTFLSLVGILGMLIAGMWMARREPLVAFCIWFYYAALALESSFLQLEMVFEHRLYVPSFGFIVAVVWGVIRLAERFEPSAAPSSATGGSA